MAGTDRANVFGKMTLPGSVSALWISSMWFMLAQTVTMLSGFKDTEKESRENQWRLFGGLSKNTVLQDVLMSEVL